MRFLVLLLAAASVLLAAPAVRAEDRASAELEHLEVELIAASTHVEPGKPLRVGLKIETDDEWHVYWQNPGDSGDPLDMAWELPAGFTAGPILWPAPSRFLYGPIANYGYEGDVLLPVTITVPETIDGDTVTIRGDFYALVCQEECVPVEATLALTLPVGQARPDARWTAAFAAADRAQPRDLEGDVSVRREDGALVLQADAARFGGDALFFPYEEAIEGAAQQKATRSGERLTLRLEEASGLDRAPDRLRGVLVIQAADGPVAFRVDAPVDGAAPAPAEPEGSIWQALLLALVGGLILNVMPCVLPVLSIKILGFVQNAQDEPARVRRHGYAFGIGVLASFLVLGGLLQAFRFAGEGLGWGFQLQDPIFVACMTVLLMLIGLNLVGVFEFGAGLMNVAGKAAGKIESKGYTGSFWSGVLATVIATPCTAPGMGYALGYALTVPVVPSMLVISMVGVGMALPYVVLSIFPRWLSKVPKPGPWMDTFKRVMAFPIFATAIWLAWVFGRQVGVNGMSALLAGLLFVAMGCWIFGHFGAVTRRPRVRYVVGYGLALVFVVVGVAVPIWAASRTVVEWEPYSEARIAAHRAAGRPVLLDFTADW